MPKTHCIFGNILISYNRKPSIRFSDYLNFFTNTARIAARLTPAGNAAAAALVSSPVFGEFFFLSSFLVSSFLSSLLFVSSLSGSSGLFGSSGSGVSGLSSLIFVTLSCHGVSLYSSTWKSPTSCNSYPSGTHSVISLVWKIPSPSPSTK